MKTEKLVEQRIEKHLDLVEHDKEPHIKTEVLPVIVNGEVVTPDLYGTGSNDKTSPVLYP